MADDVQTLQDLLTELDETAKSKGAKLSVREVLDAVETRSFGPLLLLAGLLGMTPVSAVPTAPSLVALVTIAMAVQLLIGRRSIWLPRFLAERTVKAESLRKTVRVATGPARLVDRVVKPRLTFLTGPPMSRLAGLVAILVAAAVPPLELLPFVAFFPFLVIATLGLGLIARDGVLVAVALTISVGLGAFGVWRLAS